MNRCPPVALLAALGTAPIGLTLAFIPTDRQTDRQTDRRQTDRQSKTGSKRTARHPDIAHVLGTVLQDTDTPLQHFICLCRASLDHPFTETERALTEQIAPHLVEAYNQNAVLQLAADKTVDHVIALCDRRGLIHHADTHFRPLLLTEWPDWNTSTLPFALDGYIDTLPRLIFEGRAIVVTATALDERIQLSARKKSRSENLTARERLITKHLVSGAAYKEIAALLGISPCTVTKHVNAIYRKLEVHNKTQLALVVKQGSSRS